MGYEHFSWLTLDRIHCERDRQVKKWGTQNHTHGDWKLILDEELGEAAREILEGNKPHARDELIQAAAVILAWLEEGSW